MLYLQDYNLQAEFKVLFSERDRVNYVQWLHAVACPRGIVSTEDVAWFDGFAEGSTELVATITLGYGAWLKANLAGGGTVFDLNQLRMLLAESEVNLPGRSLVSLYTGTLGVDLLAQAEQFYHGTHQVRERFPTVFGDGRGAKDFAKLLAEKFRAAANDAEHVRAPSQAQGTLAHPPPATLLARLKSAAGMWRAGRAVAAFGDRTGHAPPLQPREVQRQLAARLAQGGPRRLGVNIVGYFHAPTGAGESVRSMARTLTAGGIAHQDVPVPSIYLNGGLDIDDLATGKMFASYEPTHRVNLVVTNSEDFPRLSGLLPFAFWQGRKCIGYWVWESERLPVQHSVPKRLAEIWTPSEYSAAAIRKATTVPVRVVPHILDFEQIDNATADRARFGVPEGRVAYGFFFDCKSVMERKNPAALVRAFRKAFGAGSSEAVLVLKVSSAQLAPSEFAQLRRDAEGLSVVWVTETLTRAQTMALMKSLDVYVSLHRSEGFGLTLAEAMAMGKPVIATNYSGNVDFMAEEDSCLVRTEPFQTLRAYGPYPAGTRWSDPDVDHASAFLVTMLDAAARQRVGAAAARAIRERLSAAVVGKTARGHIERVAAN